MSLSSPKILLTGGTGFVGSHVAEEFSTNGYEVCVLHRNSTQLHRLEPFQSRLKLVNIDERDLTSVVRQDGPWQAILHLATEYGHAPATNTDVVRSNLLFPVQLLEESLAAGIPMFINADSFFSAAADDYSYLESYSLSKRQFSEWGQNFGRKGMRFCNVRLEHVFGPRDGDSKFVTSMIRQCLQNQADIALTPCTQKRDFIYVKDVVAGMKIIVENTAKMAAEFHYFELGTGESVPVRALVEEIHRSTGASIKLKFGELSFRQGEIMESKANPEKMRHMGWNPQWSLSTGLQETIAAFKKLPT